MIRVGDDAIAKTPLWIIKFPWKLSAPLNNRNDASWHRKTNEKHAMIISAL